MINIHRLVYHTVQLLINLTVWCYESEETRRNTERRPVESNPLFIKLGAKYDTWDKDDFK